MLTSRELYDLLADIRSRKLILLDTCAIPATWPAIRWHDLTGEGVPFLVFSSCERSQSSYESPKGKGNHTLFTQCLLDVLETSAEAAGKKRQTRMVTARELADAVRTKLPLRLKEFNVKEEDWQTPVFRRRHARRADPVQAVSRRYPYNPS